MTFPKKGDVIILDAEPHSGHEMGGHDPESGNIRRRYIVMSNSNYNQTTKMVMVFPITTSDYKNTVGYKPLLINGTSETCVKGFIVLWQLQNFDYISRHGKVVNRISPKLLNELDKYVKYIF